MNQFSASAWEAWLAQYPQAHILQTAAWGTLKAEFGWDVLRLGQAEAGLQVLFRSLPLGFRVAYVPKGPLGSSSAWNKLWPEVLKVCRTHRAILLLVEPDFWDDDTFSKPEGFRFSTNAIQPRRTIVINLRGSPEDILGRMKQKTRYNIRLAEKKGVQIQFSQDVAAFYRLMQTTGERDAFGIHSQAYYQRVFEIFSPSGACTLISATYQAELLAGIMAFAHGQRAWYFYGASGNIHRELMPTYALQWWAMQWAIKRGCTSYDLWGVPDQEESQLEAGFPQRSDGLWGIYRFKRGFGGELKRSAAPWEYPLNPVMDVFYRGYLRLRRRTPEVTG